MSSATHIRLPGGGDGARQMLPAESISIGPASIRYLMPRRHPYDNIYVLLTSWADDNLHSDQSKILKASLESFYNAKCEHFPIPDADSQERLENKLQRVIGKARFGYNLLIVYYGGPSGTVDGRFHLKRDTTSSDSKNSIQWCPILKNLALDPLDVLVLLNCAYTGPRQSSTVVNATEIFAASDSESYANVEPQSFTQLIFDCFQKAQGAQLTVCDMYDYFVQQKDSTNLPLHAVLSSGGQSCITIASTTKDTNLDRKDTSIERHITLKIQLESNHGQPSSEQSISAINDWLEHGLPPHGKLQPTAGGLTVDPSYSFSVQPSIAADPVQWQRFAKSMPTSVRGAKINISALTGVQTKKLSQEDTARTNLENIVNMLNLNKSFSQNLPNSNGRFKNVSVIPLMWEKVEACHKLEEDLNGVCSVFRDQYDYKVEPIFKIPSNRTKDHKTKELIFKHILANQGLDNLMIIVYAGHGKEAESDQRGPMLFCDTSSAKHELDWSKIQADLDATNCNVVVILNCCFGGNAALSTVNGRNEILSASDRDAKVYSGPDSFLKYLAQELKLASESGQITISALRERLSFYNSVDGGRRIKLPFHHQNPHGAMSIVLRPLGPVPYRAENIETSESMSKSHIGTASSLFVEYILTDPSTASQDQWNDFFATASYPDNIEGLRFYTATGLHNTFVPDH